MHSISRRTFLNSAGAATGVGVVAGKLPSKAQNRRTNPESTAVNAILLGRPSLPVLRTGDVVVVGGSFAGIAAALSLARAKRKVILVEPRTYVGREMTASLRPWLASRQPLPPMIDACRGALNPPQYPNPSGEKNSVTEAYQHSPAEIPFKLDKILEKIRLRQESGSNFSIIVIAEGAKLGEEKTFIDRDTMTGLPRLGGVGDKLASAIRKKIDLEVRTTVLGHIQRGGGPIAFDRILATRLAVEAAELVAQDKWDMMVAYKNGDIVAVPILEAIGQRKMVKPDGQIIAHARALGIAFGD